MDESKKILRDMPYWIIDGYYCQINPQDYDLIVMKKDGEELVNITDDEYNMMLNKIKSKIIKANSDVIISRFF